MSDGKETQEHLRMNAEYHKEVSAFMADPRTVLDVLNERDTLRTALIEAQSWIAANNPMWPTTPLREALEETE